MTQPNPDFTAKLDKILSDPRLRHHYQAILEAHFTAVREAQQDVIDRITAKMKPVTAWDGQESLYNSWLHEILDEVAAEFKEVGE